MNPVRSVHDIVTRCRDPAETHRTARGEHCGHDQQLHSGAWQLDIERQISTGTHLQCALGQRMAGVSKRERRAGISGMPAMRSRRMRRMACGRADARSSTARDTRSSHPQRTHLQGGGELHGCH